MNEHLQLELSLATDWQYAVDLDTESEKDDLERNARHIITTWGPPVDDYSCRVWSGLIRDFYVPRLKAVTEAMAEGNPFNRGEWEARWVQGLGISPFTPLADPAAQAAAWVKEALERQIPDTSAQGEVIGTWEPGGITGEWKTIEWTITPDRLAKLEGVRFQYTRGNHRLVIREASLVADGQVVATDRHDGERYTESALVKALEERGIGRPSTYAAVIKTLKDRDYVILDKRVVSPTSLGEATCDALIAAFPDVMDYQFTAQVEDWLDDVSRGERDWVKALRDFYDPFAAALVSAPSKMAAFRGRYRSTAELTSQAGTGTEESTKSDTSPRKRVREGSWWTASIDLTSSRPQAIWRGRSERADLSEVRIADGQAQRTAWRVLGLLHVSKMQRDAQSLKECSDLQLLFPDRTEFAGRG